MSLENLAANVSKALQTRSFSGSLKFDCGSDGVLVLADGAATLVDRPADCTIRMTRANLEKLLAGKLNPMLALATGKLTLSGNPAVALGLAKLLG